MLRIVVVLPLSPLIEGDSFAVSHWPLHITMLPPVFVDAPVERISTAVRSVASGQSAVSVTAGRDELFGRRHDVPVTLIVENRRLSILYRRLVDAVRPFAASPHEPAFTGKGFRPHVTMKAHARVHEGDELTLEQIAIVDMAPRSGPGRRVLATIPLSGK